MASFIKHTYPSTLLKLFDLPNNYLISEKNLLDMILNKCEKINTYGRPRYRIPIAIYKQLLTEQYEINAIIHSSNTTFIVTPSEIKYKLKKIVIVSDYSDYITLSSIFSDTKIHNIEVIIDLFFLILFNSF